MMMDSFVIQVIKVAVALFIITDSIGNLPIFMGLTDGLAKGERRKLFNTALLTGLVLLAAFCFAGALVFSLFDLTIEDLKIAGGVLLFLIAVEVLLRGKVVFEHKEDIGVVPMGCPLMVGPGAITTVLVMLKIYDFYAVLAGTAVCFFIIWLILFFSESIYRFLGRNGALIITKISAILIAAIAVRFIRQGVMAILGL